MSLLVVDKYYDRADFTALPGGTLVNEAVLRLAIDSLVLTEAVSFVRAIVNTATLVSVQVQWDGTPPTTADVAAVTAAIAAHTGFSTTSALQQFASGGDTTNATTAYAAKQEGGVDVDWLTPPLAAGVYQLTFRAQLLSSVAATLASGMQVICRAGVRDSTGGAALGPGDDRGYSESAYAASQLAVLYQIADSFPVQAGQRIRFQPRFRRMGTAATVTMRNAALDVLRIPG